jgi:hypothetical protein
MLRSSPEPHFWESGLDELAVDYDPGLWFLARSPDGSRLLLVHTYGVHDEDYLRGFYSHGHPDADHSVDQCGRTDHTFTTGFGCKVFSKDTSQLHPENKWERINDLGGYSLFLGSNYPIMMQVGGAGMAPGYITRSNCVYTSHYAIGLGYKRYPKICRFGLNCMEAAVGFSINITWETPETCFGSF